MLQKVFTFMKAWLEDQWADDMEVVYELVEAVRTCTLFHAEIAETVSNDKAHQRTRLCFIACQRYAEYPCEQRRLQVFAAWENLGVREKQQLRNVVRCTGRIKRNMILHELAGTNKQCSIDTLQCQ